MTSTRPTLTTWVALASNLALAGVGVYSATQWYAAQERLATLLMGTVGLLLAALVGLDLKRPESATWHYKPAALGVGATLLLLAGLYFTTPIAIHFDPTNSRVKVAGRVVSTPHTDVVRARVWPDDHDLPIVVEPTSPACHAQPAFIRVGQLLDDHRGHWDAYLPCPPPP